MDRLLGASPQLAVLRASDGATPVEPAAVLLPNPHGDVKVDVLEVRQVELDLPSDDPGDRLHASAHAWAHDTAAVFTIEVILTRGGLVSVVTPVAEPGPLVAMKLQAVINRSMDKQGIDLRDIVNLALDRETRPDALAQIAGVENGMARDIASHAGRWFVHRRQESLLRIRAVGAVEVTADDLDLVAELLNAASRRSS